MPTWRRAPVDRAWPGSSAGSGARSWTRPRSAPDRIRALLPRTGRAPRPARPLDPGRARRRHARPADVPARRAVPDALRRGLPRADRDRVPPGLALRASTHDIYEWTHPHLAKYAMAGGLVAVGRGRRQRDERARRPGPRPPSSSRAATNATRPGGRPASGCTSRPAPRSAPTTCGPRALIAASPRPGPPPSRSTRHGHRAVRRLRRRPASRRSTCESIGDAGGSRSASRRSTARARSDRAVDDLLVARRRHRPAGRVTATDLSTVDVDSAAGPRRGLDLPRTRRPGARRDRVRAGRHAGRRSTTRRPSRPALAELLGGDAGRATRRKLREAHRHTVVARQPGRRRHEDEHRGRDRRRDACRGSRSTDGRTRRGGDGGRRDVRRSRRRAAIIDDRSPTRAARTGWRSSPASSDPKLYVTVGDRRRIRGTTSSRSAATAAKDGPVVHGSQPAAGSRRARSSTTAPPRWSTCSAWRPARGERPLDGLRRRAARERRLRRRAPAGRLRARRPGPPTSSRDYPTDDRQQLLAVRRRRRRRPRSTSARTRSRGGCPASSPAPSSRRSCTSWPGSCSGGARRRARRAVRARRRDVLRPVADRHERRVRRPVHRRRLHALRGDLDRLVARPLGVLARHARHRRCCSASRSPRKWVAVYAIGALVLLILVRSALGRVLAILGMIGVTARPRLHGHHRAPRAHGLRQPDVPADHGRADPRRRSWSASCTRSPGPTTRCGSPSARAGGRSGPGSLRRAGGRAGSNTDDHDRGAGGHAAAGRARRWPSARVVVAALVLARRAPRLRATRRATGARRPVGSSTAGARRRRAGSDPARLLGTCRSSGWRSAWSSSRSASTSSRTSRGRDRRPPDRPGLAGRSRRARRCST